MFHPENLAEILSAYKEYFPEHWNRGRYKWRAILHFQRYWDLEADDFRQMFMKATEKTANLLANRSNYPRRMISQFASADAEAVRSMFRSLFDESEDLALRIGQFQASADWLRMKYDDGTWNHHYQMANAITTYLWLKNPDQYYVYKYSDALALAQAVKSDFLPIRGDAILNVRGTYQLYEEIRDVIRRDSELDQIFKDLADESCYSDPEKITMTTDLAFFVSRFYGNRGKNDHDRDRNLDKGQDRGHDRDRESRKARYRDRNREPIASWNENGESNCEQADQTILKKQNQKDAQLSTSVCKEFACEPSPCDPSESESYTREDFLSEVYIGEEDFDTLVALLKNKKNLILQGAPGVGKTFTAKRLAYAMMGKKDESKIHLIQFHQSYSYEDFIMGYKPVGEGFKLREGIFYRACKQASEDPDHEYFFLIDEINRGNLSRIFGELLMLIEKDYRGTPATLAYSQTLFSVPENLYLIGMMNTADRSLAMIDYALRRRFSFFEMEPGFSSAGFENYQKSLQNQVFDRLIEQIVDLNREIREDDSLGDGFCIGHSYVCGQNRESCTLEWMKMVVNYDILPMLREYWFDERERLLKWERRLRGVLEATDSEK
ncbi:AAA family ATPase [Brotaphodocola sp.]|uniref:AAA family ATPase n=1 Tax=Brotaphodocola sp. TaxID=3073577 RepID=UPI003D7EA9CA